MNRIVTFTLMPWTAGVMVVLLALVGIAREPPRAWLWFLVVPATVVAVFLVASLLNISIFAPVYWALSRRRQRNRHDHNGRT
jgi:hypothetical protein